MGLPHASRRRSARRPLSPTLTSLHAEAGSRRRSTCTLGWAVRRTPRASSHSASWRGPAALPGVGSAIERLAAAAAGTGGGRTLAWTRRNSRLGFGRVTSHASTSPSIEGAARSTLPRPMLTTRTTDSTRTSTARTTEWTPRRSRRQRCLAHGFSPTTCMWLQPQPQPQCQP